jgi:hypothetical protein
MAVWNLDLKVYATAYVTADTAEEALAKLRKHFQMADGTPLETLDLEVGEGEAQDFEISGTSFDDPDLPEICLSPAMTVYAPEPNAEMQFVDEGGDEEPEVIRHYRCSNCSHTWSEAGVDDDSESECEHCGTDAPVEHTEEA